MGSAVNMHLFHIPPQRTRFRPRRRPALLSLSSANSEGHGSAEGAAGAGGGRRSAMSARRAADFHLSALVKRLKDAEDRRDPLVVALRGFASFSPSPSSSPRTRADTTLRSCLFSPDGACVLTALNARNGEPSKLSILEEENSSSSSSSSSSRGLRETASYDVARGSIADYCWYPQMNSALPETCAFAAACNENNNRHPVVLFDAYVSNRRVASYSLRDEKFGVAPVVTALAMSGARIFAGTKATRVHEFHLSRAGGDPCAIDHVPRGRIVSCLDAGDDARPPLIACGTFSGHVGVLDVRGTTTGRGSSLAIAVDGTHEMMRSGVTRVKLTGDGRRVWVGGRGERHARVACFDLRNPRREPLMTVERRVNASGERGNANQRIDFDVDVHEKYLVTGSFDGDAARWFDLSSCATEVKDEGGIQRRAPQWVGTVRCTSESEFVVDEGEDDSSSHLAAPPALNGVSIDKSFPSFNRLRFATASGCWGVAGESSKSYSDEDSDEEKTSSTRNDDGGGGGKRPLTYSNVVRVWDCKL